MRAPAIGGRRRQRCPGCFLDRKGFAGQARLGDEEVLAPRGPGRPPGRDCRRRAAMTSPGTIALAGTLRLGRRRAAPGWSAPAAAATAATACGGAVLLREAEQRAAQHDGEDDRRHRPSRAGPARRSAPKTRMSTSGLSNWRSSRRAPLKAAASSTLFGPRRRSRSAAAAFDRPFAPDASAAPSSAALRLQNGRGSVMRGSLAVMGLAAMVERGGDGRGRPQLAPRQDQPGNYRQPEGEAAQQQGRGQRDLHRQALDMEDGDATRPRTCRGRAASARWSPPATP